jgi:MFS family permease
MNPPVPDPNSRPTRVRYGVLAFLCTLSFVLYLDRVCISQAADSIQAEFSIANERWSYVLMAFTLAYGLFEIPTGHMGDRLGARRVLTRIVVWWSAFTLLTAVCWGFWSLVVVRFLFGAGEAGAYPNVARVLARWFPPGERGRAQGLVLAAGLVGGSASPVLAAYLIREFGWRAGFVSFGAVGVVWAVVFAAWFRDNPADHPAVNAAERDRIGADAAAMGGRRVPWGLVFRHPVIWVLGAIITCNSFVSYVYFSWYPKYLQAGRNVEKIESGWLATLVLAGGVVGMVGGGAARDRIARSRRPLANRRVWCISALLLAALLLAASVKFESPRAAAACTAASFLFMSSQRASWWSSATEVSGRFVGSLFGLMNGLGVVGAMGSQFFFGWFSDWRKALGYTGRDRWDPAFLVCAIGLVVAAALWLAVRHLRPVDEQASRAA